ncbi:MAG: hypothetical protein VYD54_02785 [Bdellovibrionota bacterium]|nr:hypothetical protein [Bdellovibrionota bacterium]
MFLKKLKSPLWAIAFVLVFSMTGKSDAKDICRVELVDHWHDTIKVFQGNCADAKWDCNKDRRNRMDRGYSGESCFEKPMYRPPVKRVFCEVDLKDHWTDTVERFGSYGWGYSEACLNAKWDCKKKLERRNLGGESCSVITRIPHPPGTQFTCAYKLIDIRDERIIKTFSKKGSHQKLTCRRALKQCLRGKDKHFPSRCERKYFL